jgi:hypothetical protein
MLTNRRRIELNPEGPESKRPAWLGNAMNDVDGATSPSLRYAYGIFVRLG